MIKLLLKIEEVFLNDVDKILHHSQYSHCLIGEKSLLLNDAMQLLIYKNNAKIINKQAVGRKSGIQPKHS